MKTAELAKTLNNYKLDVVVDEKQYIIVRVDGYNFSHWTGTCFTKPFDNKFNEVMDSVARTLLGQLSAVFAYATSDEVSLLLAPNRPESERDVSLLLSRSAATATAIFLTDSMLGHNSDWTEFSSELYGFDTAEEVVDYFSFRQATGYATGVDHAVRHLLARLGYKPRSISQMLDGLNLTEKEQYLEKLGAPLFGEFGATVRSLQGSVAYKQVQDRQVPNPKLHEIVAVARPVVVQEVNHRTGSAFRALVERRIDTPVRPKVAF